MFRATHLLTKIGKSSNAGFLYSLEPVSPLNNFAKLCGTPNLTFQLQVKTKKNRRLKFIDDFFVFI